jgi:hypothetical protein
MFKNIAIVLASLICLLAAGAKANVTTYPLCREGAVLQQNTNVTIWGTSSSGEVVTVGFRGNTNVVVANGSGQWWAKIPSGAAGGPFTLSVSGANTLTYTNILVGEVWVISGQSNMTGYYGGVNVLDAAEIFEATNAPPNSNLRFYGETVGANWVSANPTTVLPLSAVGYFFAKNLQASLGVPVGIYQGAMGGTPISAWLVGGVCYNSVIAPVASNQFRGVVWYQGCSDRIAPDCYTYRTNLSTLVDGWRSSGTFNNPSLAFTIIQIAIDTPTNESAFSFRDAVVEADILNVNRYGLGNVVAYDWGDVNVHPTSKRALGYRAYLSSLGITYGSNIVHSSPMCRSIEISSTNAILTFNNARNGLITQTLTSNPTLYGGSYRVVPNTTNATALQGIRVIIGENNWVNQAASATIIGNTVVVNASSVSYVGYGNFLGGYKNLYNAEGLPANQFRSDDVLFSPLYLKASSGGSVMTTNRMLVAKWLPIPISATPETGYVFTNWTILQGPIDIANPYNTSTTITVTNDWSVGDGLPRAIRANFKPYLDCVITTPTNVTVVNTGVDLTVSASAAVLNGSSTITKVQFFRGTTLLGESYVPPYTCTWSNALAGKWKLTAKAIDSLNVTNTSRGVFVEVATNGVRSGLSLSGGTVTYYTDNKINWIAHTFTSSGSLTAVSNGVVQYLVVAGGGGGGGTWESGGGGAGGVRTGVMTMPAGTYSITVGDGGSGQGQGGLPATNGSPSSLSNSILSVTALGGGYGGSSGSSGGGVASDGGSGGGGLWSAAVPGRAVGGADSLGHDGGLANAASGGGGAGSVGQSASPYAGGSGIDLYFTGETVTYAAGGAGRPRYSGSLPPNRDGFDSFPNTGQGGVAGSSGVGGSGAGGKGGSGIVVVRYAFSVDADPNLPYSSSGDITYPTNLNGRLYGVHIFTNTVGTNYFTTTKDFKVEYLIIGGGGASGSSIGGGGGAGGYRCSVPGEWSGSLSNAEPRYSVNAGIQYPVVVGAGGASAQMNGGDSWFTNIVSIGGGGGRERNVIGTPNGGSGGGGGYDGTNPYSATNSGSGMAGQGFKGGNCGYLQVGFTANGGGGGGAGSAGVNGKALSSGQVDPSGSGGTGLWSSITGIAVGRAGGGAGGGVTWGAATNFGGGVNVTGRLNGAPSTGGGGGHGGNGGSGVVILRYDMTPPTITVNAASNGFDDVIVNTTGTWSYTVSAVELTNNITVTAPSAEFTLATNGGAYGSQVVLATNTNGSVSNTTINVHFVPTLVHAYAGTITNASAGAADQLVTLTGNGVPYQPMLTVTPKSLSLGNVITNKTSANFVYTLSGILLEGDVTVTAPSASFAVSTNAAGPFGPSCTVSVTPPTLSNTPIYVQFTPSAGSGPYAGSITNASQNATSKMVAVTGTGVVQSLYVSAGTLTFVNVITNTISATNYTVWGSNLEANVTVTAPSAEFTVSTNNLTGFGASCTVLVANANAPSGGSLTATPIYVKFTPTALGAYSGAITNRSAGVADQPKAVSGTGPVTVSLTAPAAGQVFSSGASISLTATVVPGTAPYGVKIYTNRFSGGYGVATNAAATSNTTITVPLGVLTSGAYHVYATVTDSVSAVVFTSATNTFVVQPPILAPMLASGGDVTSIITNYAGTSSQTVYGVHQFTNVGDAAFVPLQNLKVEYLVIGGGGGGGRSRAGGGGAGGYRCSVQGELSGANSVAEAVYPVSAGVTYPVVVGKGGAGATLDTGYQGGNSFFTNIVAIGGGGGKERANTTRADGGSGGGGGYLDNTEPQPGGSGTAGQGFKGGSAVGNADSWKASYGGGGGGAGSPGTDGKLISDPWGSGGTGLVSSITGTAVQRAGGGGGGQVTWGVATNYGGGVDVTGRRNGATSTGGGGAARWDNADAAGEGGSGIVIVRYVANGGGGAVAPAAPTNFTATAAGTNQINLAWADQATDETGYVVDRSTDSNTWVLVVVTSVNVTNTSSTGLTTNTLYYYRVAATNAGGRSAYGYASARTWSVYEAWRQTQFDSTSLTNSAISGATADPDYDGLNNEQEFWAGTIPTNAASCLVMIAPTNNPVVAGGGFVVSWQSVTDHWYTVQSATSLLTGFNLNLRTNIPATPPVNVHTDSVGGAGQKFYRVGVE